MSLKLHGLPISNYYNVAKTALLEKGVAFEEVMLMPSQDENVLAMSPMGKIPVLEIDGRFLPESQAIIAYLERAYPEPSLVPADSIDAGRAQQIHQFTDLYIDGAARKLLGAAFMGRETTPETIEEVSGELNRAMKALARTVSFDHFVVGDSLSHADIAVFWQCGLASEILTALGQPDPAAVLNYSEYKDRLSARPAFAESLAARKAAFEQMMKDRNK